MALSAFDEIWTAAARYSATPQSKKKYAEGRAVRLEVRTAKDFRNVEKLAVIKMKN